MSENEEPEEIFIPTPEEVDEDRPRSRRRQRSGSTESAGPESKRRFTGFLRKVAPHVGQNRGRAQPPAPSRPAKPAAEPEPKPVQEPTPVAKPSEEEQKAVRPPRVESATPAPARDVPPQEAQVETPKSEPPRLRKIRSDSPARPSSTPETPTGYKSRNGATEVLRRAKKKGHVLGEFKEEWDGPNRTESALCQACGAWGAAVHEVADGWTEDTAYVQYKGPATNRTCRGTRSTN